MWGREMRAGLIFVLASLLVGSAFREWKRSHEARFQDLIADLESRGEAGRPLLPVGSVPDSAGGLAPDAAVDSAGPPRSKARPRRAVAPALTPAGIDLDRASSEELERLPGIGPGLAARIVLDRRQNGPFRNPDGLLRVRGIGPRTLERIRPYLWTPTPADSVSPIAN
jgi:competence ComEA-like helix-hairpin-helix protein